MPKLFQHKTDTHRIFRNIKPALIKSIQPIFICLLHNRCRKISATMIHDVGVPSTQQKNRQRAKHVFILVMHNGIFFKYASANAALYILLLDIH